MVAMTILDFYLVKMNFLWAKCLLMYLNCK